MFSRGRLVDASTSSESGESAALIILSWQTADLYIFELQPRELASIYRPLSELILEAARLCDEESQNARDDD